MCVTAVAVCGGQGGEHRAGVVLQVDEPVGKQCRLVMPEVLSVVTISDCFSYVQRHSPVTDRDSAAHDDSE